MKARAKVKLRARMQRARRASDEKKCNHVATWY